LNFLILLAVRTQIAASTSVHIKVWLSQLNFPQPKCLIQLSPIQFNDIRSPPFAPHRSSVVEETLAGLWTIKAKASSWKNGRKEEREREKELLRGRSRKHFLLPSKMKLKVISTTQSK